MRYLLSASISDRINFDNMAKRVAADDMRLLSDNDLASVLEDLDGYIDRVSEMYLQAFDYENPDSKNYIDDREEAVARFRDSYKRVVLEEAHNRLQNREEERTRVKLKMR